MIYCWPRDGPPCTQGIPTSALSHSAPSGCHCEQSEKLNLWSRFCCHGFKFNPIHNFKIISFGTQVNPAYIGYQKHGYGKVKAADISATSPIECWLVNKNIGLMPYTVIYSAIFSVIYLLSLKSWKWVIYWLSHPIYLVHNSCVPIVRPLGEDKGMYVMSIALHSRKLPLAQSQELMLRFWGSVPSIRRIISTSMTLGSTQLHEIGTKFSPGKAKSNWH